jgi:hypothetical protein
MSTASSGLTAAAGQSALSAAAPAFATSQLKVYFEQWSVISGWLVGWLVGFYDGFCFDWQLKEAAELHTWDLDCP